MENNHEFQKRLNNAFGALGSPDNAWKPTSNIVFRSGSDNIEDDDAVENEYEEHLRREVLPGMAMDLAEEDVPDEDGYMASVSFCKRMDQEAEADADDFLADPQVRIRVDVAHRPPSTNFRNNAKAPSPSKSSLKRSSLGVRKKVSFTGLPQPWVPPHRRAHFTAMSMDNSDNNDDMDNNMDNNNMDNNNMDNNNMDDAEYGAEMNDATTSTKVNGRVPDFITHPHRYTKYELDETLIVGGGWYSSAE